MTDSEFIEFVKGECKYYGIKCDLRKGKFARYLGSSVGGCFDDSNKVLVSSLNREDWMQILAHEYCHLTQWAEKCPEWMKSIEFDCYTKWDRHLKGEKVEMDIHFEIMRDLELDNEKRTVALIKRLDLPIDVKAYTKRANAYVMFYNYMKITGKWAKQNNSPYKNERLLAALPDRFSLNYNVLPKRLERIFREERI